MDALEDAVAGVIAGAAQAVKGQAEKEVGEASSGLAAADHVAQFAASIKHVTQLNEELLARSQTGAAAECQALQAELLEKVRFLSRRPGFASALAPRISGLPRQRRRQFCNDMLLQLCYNRDAWLPRECDDHECISGSSIACRTSYWQQQQRAWLRCRNALTQLARSFTARSSCLQPLNRGQLQAPVDEQNDDWCFAAQSLCERFLAPGSRDFAARAS